MRKRLSEKPLTKSATLKLGELLEEFDERLGARLEPEILTLTEKMGFVSQRERFSKRLAIADTSDYKLIGLNDIAFNPYLLWAGAIAQNTRWKAAIISPLYPTFHVRKGYNARFVNHLLCSGFLRSRYGAISYGSVPRKRRAAVNDFLDLPIRPQPPLAEQGRIVELLDEADELRKLRTQADRRALTLITAVFTEMFADSAKKSSRCPLLPLGEIVNFGSGATPAKENPEFWNGRTPWVSPKDMKAEEITDAEDHVSALAFEQSGLQLFPKNTVLIVVRGMILARAVPIRLCRVPFAINQDMKALLPKQNIEPEFLRWALQAQHAHLLSQVSTAAHGTKKLDSEKLKATTIPFPSLILQKEFVRLVREIHQLESAQAKSRARLDKLFASLLNRVLNGEL